MTAVDDFISNLRMYRNVADSAPMVGDVDLFVAALQELVTGSGPPSGPAGGDLGGTYPNPTVIATHLTVPLPVAQGGTALASGTSGGILGFITPGVIASSVALGASQLILGGGAGETPTALGTLGTSTTVLHGNAAGAPTFGAVALTTDVSGTLPIGNGGTGTATQFTQGSIIFAGASGIYSQSNSNLFWDNSNNRIGLRTASPTHTVTLSSISTGEVLYNTSDQTTNFERLRLSWSSNVAQINTEKGGTGTVRELFLGNTNSKIRITPSTTIALQTETLYGAVTGSVGVNITDDITSLSSTCLAVQSQITQSSIAGYTILALIANQISTGSGAKLLISGQTEAGIVFSVDNTGLITTNSTTLIASNVALTNNAAAQVGTLTNSPTAGNPTKWIPINDNGTIRNIPTW